jgi:glycosyltransferase involved in cell wall biosynthesis
MDGRLPFVSVIIPARNEGEYIERCLASLIAQDYPVDRLEILFVDGMSTDATRAIVADYCRRYQHLRLLENPRRVVPAALNIGLRAARGEIIVRVDGHCLLAPDYISRCVERRRLARPGDRPGHQLPFRHRQREVPLLERGGVRRHGLSRRLPPRGFRPHRPLRRGARPQPRR